MQEEQAQQTELENLERSNQALQRDVARFEEREKLTQEVRLQLLAVWPLRHCNLVHLCVFMLQLCRSLLD